MTDQYRNGLPVLVLTGGPAVGKSSTALALALVLDRLAVIDVDDLRQLVVSGHAAPWEGAEGCLQRQLGVRNACALARNFMANGFSVIVADVVTSETADLYRELLDDVLLIHLTISHDEARRRAAKRPVSLTPEEFERLHAAQESDPPQADLRIEVTDLIMSRQVEAVRARWQQPNRESQVT